MVSFFFRDWASQRCAAVAGLDFLMDFGWVAAFITFLRVPINNGAKIKPQHDIRKVWKNIISIVW